MARIDTNVLARNITQHHPEQYRAANRHLESNCTQETLGHIKAIVLCQLAWALTTAYDATSEEVARVIDQPLRTCPLQIQCRDRVRSALAEYSDSKAGFPDCLTVPRNREEGADETVTLNQDAAQMGPWRELKG